ncbi:T9SS type A sorting domain-containing protein [Aequorivita sp. F47161]|uniref:T9SS type A sorting domain-containing protein n=1 Tax=Aequorivita vitellina TaxID=2874475 RepID=A0A9X1QV48_9FLAO|nr:T9SS type A sorting domain-containing protein [Aequorivita vitellina]MCG2417703.1 T9SS type A sorting domain-containing protein [Aequorivita vitellina]
MKTTLFYLLFGVSTVLISQNSTEILAPASHTFQPANIEKTECISDLQRQEIRQQIALNKQKILQENPNAFQHRGGSPLFIMPLRPKAGFDDYGYYIINNQVDHDLTPNGNLLDYECGERTYDWNNGNHEGTDYVLWPYPWKRMQEEIMEIVAAAPGTIIDKRDGNFDMNCVNTGNPNWNGIIIEHADGSQAWYWHFKDGAITSKNIGETVSEGEYLGAAGSSGSSTIPHLHFEIYDAGNNLIDPYEGPCNSMNANSWFLDQPDYFVPEINHLSTHNSTNFDDDCGVVENTYEELNFEPGDPVILRLFYRDIRTNDDTHIVITKPDGTALYDWVFTSPWPNYTGAYAEWNFPTDGTWPDGVYTVTATYYGNTYETIFGINTNLGVEDLKLTEVSVYPNPASDKVLVEANLPIEKIEIFDLLGRKVVGNAPLSTNTELNITSLKTGMYVAVITTEGKKTVRKIVKE